MNKNKNPTLSGQPEPSKSSVKKARLSSALRENLKRRKAAPRPEKPTKAS